ncbi:hypothetical protein SAMN05216474_0300 [Lishizhenia tianjinensis]|uniref:Uncharacterized protein n=1 Tax=Lishizhenia tianjinensis TaxID=477690 RepID=A0A1I6XLN1_9FLAO|nr:hypothetical protein [Lishizhenia tianjinensis]SFT39235.1 hypothetical protein SAMN05216474_0300 [Lishizhenia tianjinensis]
MSFKSENKTVDHSNELQSAKEILHLILHELILELSVSTEIKQIEFTTNFLHSSKKLHRVLRIPFDKSYGDKDYQKIAEDAKILIDKLFLDKHFNFKVSDRVLNEVLQYYQLEN